MSKESLFFRFEADIQLETDYFGRGSHRAYDPWAKIRQHVTDARLREWFIAWVRMQEERGRIHYVEN